jgi:hypothetical protein
VEGKELKYLSDTDEKVMVTEIYENIRGTYVNPKLNEKCEVQQFCCG